MRYRMGGSAHTGLGGNNSPHLINERGTGNKKRDDAIRACAKDAYETFFKDTALDHGYVNAGVQGFEIRFGIEPSYMYEDLKMICFDESKKCSRIVTGIAWGPWGSHIASNQKFYDQYKRRAKFVRFIDKWHEILYAK